MRLGLLPCWLACWLVSWLVARLPGCQAARLPGLPLAWRWHFLPRGCGPAGHLCAQGDSTPADDAAAINDDGDNGSGARRLQGQRAEGGGGGGAWPGCNASAAVAMLLQPGPGTGALLAVRRCLGAPANLSQDQLAAPAGGPRRRMLLLGDPLNPALPPGTQSEWAVAGGQEGQGQGGGAARRAAVVGLMASYLDAVGAALAPLDRLAATLHGLGRTAGQLPWPGRVLLQEGSPAEGCFPSAGQQGSALGALNASAPTAGAGAGAFVIVSAEPPELTCDTPTVTADAAAVSALAAAAADIAAAGTRVQVGSAPPDGADRPARGAGAGACEAHHASTLPHMHPSTPMRPKRPTRTKLT